MYKEWNLDVRPEPYWLMEAMVCMNYVPTLDSEEWLNKHSSWNRRQKEQFLVPYRSYRGAMRAGLQPIFEQYPMLSGYVDDSPRKWERESLCSYDPPMIAFLLQMQDILEAEELPVEEELEKALNCAFGRMLGNDLQKSPDTGEIKINGLADIMTALEGWDGEDADKFKLLRLYSERREIIEQLWSFREPCREIGRRCLDLLQERYDACMEKARNQEELEALLNGVGLQCEERCHVQIVPAIMRYDMILFQALEGTELAETVKTMEVTKAAEPVEAAEMTETNSAQMVKTTEAKSVELLEMAKMSEAPEPPEPSEAPEPSEPPEAPEPPEPSEAPEAPEPPTFEPMKLKIYLGIETFYMFESKAEDNYNDNRLISRLKALGDPARLKILRQLVERPCYVQEMAKAMELTPATILHHLGILMTEELIEIQMTKEKRKVYYQVRKQGLQEIGKEIMNLTLSRQEREARQREQQMGIIQERQQKQGGWQWTIQK